MHFAFAFALARLRRWRWILIGLFATLDVFIALRIAVPLLAQARVRDRLEPLGLQWRAGVSSGFCLLRVGEHDRYLRRTPRALIELARLTLQLIEQAFTLVVEPN